jgi:hypothetical protein
MEKIGADKTELFCVRLYCYYLFPRRLCAVTLAGLLALSISVPPSHPPEADSG